jgi:hypothetical protein
MRERELNKDREEVENEISNNNQRPKGSSSSQSRVGGGGGSTNAYQPELVDRLFVKMSERLEQKIKKEGPVKKKDRVEGNKDYEESLHN